MLLLIIIGKSKLTFLTQNERKAGSTEIWTRIAGFRVQSANRYTMEPLRHLKEMYDI